MGKENGYERKAKEKTALDGAEVWIDGFNTVITLEVVFSGSTAVGAGLI